jgi:hypothetical protein
MKKIVVLGLPLLLAAGGAGAYMTGQLDPLLGVEPPAEGAEAEAPPPLPPTGTEFVELKDIGISVIRDGLVFEVVFLDLSLEVTAEARPLVEQHRPLMLDRLQAAMRELFSYRSRRGMDPIDVVEMKSVVLTITRRMFGEEAILDAHLLSDWVTAPGT